MKRDMGRWVVFSGGYTEPIQMASGEIVPGRGKGIGVCAVDAVSGRITCSAMLPSTPNPSHLTTTSDGRFLYCVSELKEACGICGSTVSAYAVEEGGARLRLLSRQATCGADACFVCLWHNEKWLLAANYSGGSVAVFPVGEDHALGAASCVLRHSGCGTDVQRQESPHPHQILPAPDGHHVYVPDLGLDRLVCYRFDEEAGWLIKDDWQDISGLPGQGIRHGVFSADGTRLYVMTEMAAQVNVYSYDPADGSAELLQVCDTVSGTTDSLGAAIRLHPSGRWLYVSVRGADVLVHFRIGEDGRLYFAGKSEHYQIPLGHDFPGYSLIENAKRLGIPNATHNNTRGFITRTLERRLIAAANGLQPTDPALDRILSQKEPGVLNTVINLETGSLAVEAALKMMLSRFYTIDGAPAQYAGRVPVFVVMADNAGGVTGNYHGTTVLAQTLRGLWPDFYTAAQKNELYKVVSVPINDSGAFAETMRRWNEGKYKTAGFCHEIVLMNYGGIRLSEEYLQAAYKVCRATDTPVLCDEIQSCAWYDGLFLFRKYGLTPDFVSVGKGFPGGVYPASKILTSAAFDSLSQFGALVTNGQEELASLAYLVTMEFIGANGAHIEAAGRYYHEQVRALAQKYPQVCTGVEGDAHMTALCFDSVDDAVDFCTRMNRDRCVDISAQTYKPNCPPVALTKLPLITTETMAGRLVALFDSALAETAAQKGAAL